VTTTELETLVVKLVGDGSSYSRMMTTAAQQSQVAATAVQAAGKQIEGISKSLKGFAESAVSALAGFGLATSLKGAFEEFSSVEREAIKFNSVLEFNKRNVEQVSAEYKKFVETLEDVTTVDKYSALALLKQAETMGFTGQKAEELTKFSIGLGQATNKSAQEALTIAIALERGNLQMLRRIPALRGIKNEQQLLAKANELANLGLKQEEALTKTASFQIEKLGRSFKEISIEIGGMVAEGLKPFLKIMQQAVEQIKALPEETKKWIVWITAGTLAFLAIKPAITTVILLMDALGISFVVNTALQLGQLAITGAAWLAWAVVVNTATLLAAGAVALYNLAMGTLAFMFGLFGGNVALSILSLVSWKTVVAIASALTTAFGFVLTVVNSLLYGELGALIGMGPAFLAYAAWSAIADAATWLLNAGLTYMDATMFGIPLVIGVVVVAFIAFVGVVLLAAAATAAFVVSLTVVGGVLGAVAVGFAGIVAVGAGIVTVFAGIGGGLWDIVSGFKQLTLGDGAVGQLVNWSVEWYQIIKDIVRALQVDMPLAWELVKAAAALAVAEIKLLWPPLWAFIRDSGMVVIEFIGDAFSGVFKNLWDWMQSGWDASWSFVESGFKILFTLIDDLTQIAWADMKDGLTTSINESIKSTIVPFYAWWKFIRQGWSNVADFYRSINTEAVTSSIKDNLLPYQSEWKYIKAGWAAVAGYIKQSQSEAKGGKAISDPDKFVPGRAELDKALEDATKSFPGTMEAALGKAQKAMSDLSKDFTLPTPNLLKDLQGQLEKAKTHLKEVMERAAKAGLEDSPEVIAAKAEVDRLRGKVNEAEARKAQQAGITAGANFNKGMGKELQKLQGVLAGSAEALSRINEYRDKLVEERSGSSTSASAGPATGGAPVVIPAGPNGGGAGNNQAGPTFGQLVQAIQYLAMIAANTGKPGAPVVRFGNGGAG
jgi:hypothetical protein